MFFQVLNIIFRLIWLGQVPGRNRPVRKAEIILKLGIFLLLSAYLLQTLISLAETSVYSNGISLSYMKGQCHLLENTTAPHPFPNNAFPLGSCVVFLKVRYTNNLGQLANNVGLTYLVAGDCTSRRVSPEHLHKVIDLNVTTYNFTCYTKIMPNLTLATNGPANMTEPDPGDNMAILRPPGNSYLLTILLCLVFCLPLVLFWGGTFLWLGYLCCRPRGGADAPLGGAPPAAADGGDGGGGDDGGAAAALADRLPAAFRPAPREVPEPPAPRPPADLPPAGERDNLLAADAGAGGTSLLAQLRREGTLPMPEDDRLLPLDRVPAPTAPSTTTATTASPAPDGASAPLAASTTGRPRMVLTTDRFREIQARLKMQHQTHDGPDHV